MIDVWMQHPTLRHAQHEMFDSLRRWLGGQLPTDALPLERTIGAMDEGGVEIGLTAASYGPAGDLISNDEVAAFVEQYPDRLRGVAGADRRAPMTAVRELRRRVAEGFVALRVVPCGSPSSPTSVSTTRSPSCSSGRTPAACSS